MKEDYLSIRLICIRGSECRSTTEGRTRGLHNTGYLILLLYGFIWNHHLVSSSGITIWHNHLEVSSVSVVATVSIVDPR